MLLGSQPATLGGRGGRCYGLYVQRELKFQSSKSFSAVYTFVALDQHQKGDEKRSKVRTNRQMTPHVSHYNLKFQIW